MVSNKEVYVSYCEQKIKALKDVITELSEKEFYYSEPKGMQIIACLKDLKMEIERA